MYKNFLLIFCLHVFTTGVFAQTDTYTGALTLEQCVQIALENNLTLQRSRLTLVSSEAALLEAQGQMIPSFSTSLSSGFRWGRSINPVTNLFETRRIGNVNVSASGNVPIYAGRQINNRIQQTKTEVEIGRLNVAATENDIQLNVINLFVNVAFAKEQVNIAQSQLRTVSEQLERTRRLVMAGSLPRADLLDLEAQTATTELELINARNNHRIARLNLSQQLLLSFTDDFDIVVPDFNADNLGIVGVGVAEIYGTAAGLLPQIKAAEMGVNSAELGVRIAKGAFLPTLGVNANVFSNYVDQTTFIPRDPLFRQFENNLSQSMNMALNIPVFSQFRNRAGLQRARVQRRLSEIQEVEVKNQLRQEIETAYTSAFASKQSFESSKKRVAALEESFRMATQRFEVGAINAVDYQIAQNNLFNAQADLITSKYEFVFRAKVLDFYLGNPLSLN
ncbi:putative outer membrane transport/efflux protein [Lunatimonas lonarensis]|uniref:Putative outer membrane transport/efflux protein n=1 Tax=Lunatimonas lonarensis TaxID=1232681 RepID=R7ZSY1_9BACT|nr:TolC family protein [Lunatimonas lonarensis]EON77138.1 putative outer membrane transport/efflux protein [Lunatimonas lonarensis]